MTWYDEIRDTEELIEEMAEPLVPGDREVDVSITDTSRAVDDISGREDHEDILATVASINDSGEYPTSTEVYEETPFYRGLVVSALFEMSLGGLVARRRWSDGDPFEYRVTAEGREELHD